MTETVPRAPATEPAPFTAAGVRRGFVAGYWLMGLVRTTPRFEAALKAAPLAVMVGIVAPAALHGSAGEAARLVTTAAVMRWRRNDLLAALAGLVVVAAVRALQ